MEQKEYRLTLIRLIPKTLAFIEGNGRFDERQKEAYRRDAREYADGKSGFYGLEIQTAVLGVYLRSGYGRDLKGDAAQYFNQWDFIDRELPSTPENNKLKDSALILEHYIPYMESGIEKETTYNSWSETMDTLFSRALESFLEKIDNQPKDN